LQNEKCKLKEKNMRYFEFCNLNFALRLANFKKAKMLRKENKPMSKKVLFCLLSLVLAYSFIPGDGLSQDYPTREIELISGFGPGSSNDSTARLTARFVEKYVGKPIVVVNKAGGGGTRGYSFVLEPNRMDTPLEIYLQEVSLPLIS